MSKIVLNFFGEIISVERPKSLASLRNEIARLFCFSKQDADEILLTYVEDGDKLIIENENDLKAFLDSKVTVIDLDISQNSKIFKDNLNQIKEETLKDKEELEALQRKKEELNKLEETKFAPEREEMKKIHEKIMELHKQKKEIKKKMFEGIRLIEKEKKELDKKIVELQKKMGISVEEKKNKKEECKKCKFPFHHGKNMRFGPPFFPFPFYNNFPHRFPHHHHRNPFRFPDLSLSFNPQESPKNNKNEKEIHYGIICDGCGMKPLTGKRYKCKKCNDFDYCQKCYEKNKETHGHEFQMIEKSQFKNLFMPFHPFRPHKVNPFMKLQKFMEGLKPEESPKKMEHCPTMGNIFEKEKISNKVMHFGVKCDGCGAYPIVGCRYKCAVCNNFDYCEQCEKKLSEKHNHPFLKIYEPKMNPIFFKCIQKNK